MIKLCTLFDSNYLSRGFALYTSLQYASAAFHLYVVAFDKKCYDFLKKANLPNLTVISLTDFEDEALLKVKPARSAAEYCWTCTPSVILHCLEKYELPSCTYVDADMIFYQDPKILLDEMGAASVLISEHRYTKDYDVSDTHGIYCVQFMCFKNTEQGLIVLKWWRERCLEWCYARLENGKFGDQKYLDDMSKLFDGIHVLQHLGGGVAPWNVQQYEFYSSKEKIYLRNKINKREFAVVFYHFHGLKFYTNEYVSFCGAVYELSKSTKDFFYIPYVKKLLEIEEELKSQGVLFNVTGAKTATPSKGEVFIEFLRNFGSMILQGKVSPLKPRNYNFRMHYHFYKLGCFK